MTDHHALLAMLERPHMTGHTCNDQPALTPHLGFAWFNPNAGSTGPCPTLTALRDLRAELDRLTARPPLHDEVHAQAHQRGTALLVGAAAAGYDSTDVAELGTDYYDGFVSMGRMALEALAEHLQAVPGD